jgi:hypothetical protein
MSMEKSGRKKKPFLGKNQKHKVKMSSSDHSRLDLVRPRRSVLPFHNDKIIALLQRAYDDQRIIWTHKHGSDVGFKIDRSAIPWWDVVFQKGTSNPVLRMNFNATKISVSAATAYSLVFTAMYSNLTNAAALQAVFDEYRWVRGKLRYMPNCQPYALAVAVQPFFGATLDYDDVTALTVLPSAFDTVKWGHIVGANCKEPAMDWVIMPDWAPDTNWISTAVQNVHAAYWKPFMPSTHNLGTIETGYLVGWMEVQFRQMI